MQSLFPATTGGNAYSITTPQLQIPNYQMPQPQIQHVASNQLIRVNGVESAKAYPTQPNSMYALFDENDDIMYIKITDASNFPTIKRFRFKEEKEEDVINDKYVTVKEFNKFKEEILNAKQSVWNDKSNKQNGNKQRNSSAERSGTNQKNDGAN